jgi:hypothetical protein
MSDEQTLDTTSGAETETPEITSAACEATKPIVPQPRSMMNLKGRVIDPVFCGEGAHP